MQYITYTRSALFVESKCPLFNPPLYFQKRSASPVSTHTCADISSSDEMLYRPRQRKVGKTLGNVKICMPLKCTHDDAFSTNEQVDYIMTVFRFNQM